MQIILKKGLLFNVILVYSTLFAYSQKTFELNGRIEDFDTGIPVKNVLVRTKSSSFSIATNDSGYFKLFLPYGYHALLTSHPGYTNTSTTMNVRKTVDITIRLKQKADNMLDEVIVNAMIRRNKVNETQMSTVTINPEQLRRIPVLFGEPDIIKALIIQPGVTTAGEGAGGFHVRGGNADQNLILLDGAPLFNTSHLLGFYSSVSPDVVENITLYKGSAPASYGGRLASLLNIAVKPGKKEGIGFTGGISPVSIRLFSEAALIKNKLSFTGGTRIAYPNAMMKLFPKSLKNNSAFFYDVIAKAEYTFNPDHTFFITYYSSFDKFRFDTTTGYQWKSELASARYSGKLSSRLDLSVSANFSAFNSDMEGLEKNYESILTSYIKQTEMKTDLKYKLSGFVEVFAGLNGINYNILPSRERAAASGSNIIERQVEQERGRELAAYLNSEVSFSQAISLQAGIRFIKYEYTGPKNIFSYEDGQPKSRESVADTTFYKKGDPITSYGGVEPRISLRILLNSSSSVKFGFHRSQQFLHLITNTTAISPVDFWKLSDPHVKQQKGSQYSAGYFKDFNGYDISLEGYYRKFENQLEYKNGAILLLNPVIETTLVPAEGYAFGSELSITKSTGKITGQINYAYSRTRIRVNTPFENEKVNQGEYYNSNSDRPHTLSFITRTKLRAGWTFNTSFLYMSGRPSTYPDGTYNINNQIVTNYSRRNHDRLPDYHRLDVSFSCVTRRIETQKRYSIWNFSVYNIYGRANAYSIFFRRENTSLHAYRLSVIGSVIPSLSWNYHF